MSRVFTKGKTAVITGAASGIGRAAAKRFASLGMNVVMADTDTAQLKSSAASFPEGGGKVLTMTCDVSDVAHLRVLRDYCVRECGAVHVLMNNAGVAGDRTHGGTRGFLDHWRTLFEVNFWGQRNGLEVFVDEMHAHGEEAVVICTGSKQGITNPPGNGAYNATKAAVKSMAEHLAWELRESKSLVSAHLLVPGWTFTGMTGAGVGRGDEDAAAAAAPEKPAGAWTADQVVGYMLDKVDRGEFYIICPDNSVDTATDNARMQWNVEDIVQRRPALSRWSEEYKDEFEAFMKEKVGQKKVSE